MIEVKLINHGIAKDPELISFAAKTCYQAEEPKMGELIDIEKRLFATGHHTTLQHSYFTFYIDGIAISDITLGLHLANPFYNTSQRSGRFCGKMFLNPNYEEIGQYIKNYWPSLDSKEFSTVLNFIKNGIEIYQANIEKATKVAAEFIKEERPFASEKYIAQNAPKFAQEQLRMFISTIFPTALTYTVNLSTIIALYHSTARNSPVLFDLTQKMANSILEKYPEFKYMFPEREEGRFLPDMIPIESSPKGILTKPKVRVFSVKDIWKANVSEHNQINSIDILHFDPSFMDYNTKEIKTEVEISLATMGQDQRHRTVRRGMPRFTENFYLPPIAAELGLIEEARTLLKSWCALGNSTLPTKLVSTIAPYGAMVKYEKIASHNAAIHESRKRLCWCAQEEIFHASLQLRQKIAERIEQAGSSSNFLSIFSPACVRTGKCGEGDRYCGRDLKKDCFIKRKV